MNRIGMRIEYRMCSRSRGSRIARRRARSRDDDGAGPGGTRVRGSRWLGWRSVTGGSYGRPAPAGSAWTRPSATTATAPTATCAAARASTPAPSCAPPGSGNPASTPDAGRGPRRSRPGARRHSHPGCPSPGRGGSWWRALRPWPSPTMAQPDHGPARPWPSPTMAQPDHGTARPWDGPTRRQPNLGAPTNRGAAQT
jgi:hypothetical protein